MSCKHHLSVGQPFIFIFVVVLVPKPVNVCVIYVSSLFRALFQSSIGKQLVVHAGSKCILKSVKRAQTRFCLVQFQVFFNSHKAFKKDYRRENRDFKWINLSYKWFNVWKFTAELNIFKGKNVWRERPPVYHIAYYKLSQTDLKNSLIIEIKKGTGNSLKVRKYKLGWCKINILCFAKQTFEQ